MQFNNSRPTRRGLLVSATAAAASLLATPALALTAGAIQLPQDIESGDEATVLRVPTRSSAVAMTFDDGPHPTLTPALLDMLKRRGIRATFYVIGQNALRYPRLMQRIAAEGHEVGNHTWRHPYLNRMGTDAIQDELDKTTLAVFHTTGRAPVTMRPPYGALDLRQRKMVYETRGMPTVLWSVDPRDWQQPGSQVVADRIVGRAHRGGIILAHDIHRATVRAMPAALDGLIARGFQFVTVSELMGWPRWDTRRFQLNTG